MTQKIKFTKMHGLGNDFVMIHERELDNTLDIKKLAINISNRHTGIGCDQFIIYSEITDTKSNEIRYSMRIYNQDGSYAKFCGNASRCLAKLIYLQTGESKIILHINNRDIPCEIIDQNIISVAIEEISFDEPWMPSLDKIWLIAERYMIDLKEVICVDVGNPHIVIFSALSKEDQNIIAEKLQERSLFPDGVNVNFATIDCSSDGIAQNRLKLSVWERGAGLTLACGSGACASFAAAKKLGFLESPCNVIFKLGSLNMVEEGKYILMQGPADLVATGEFYYE